MMVTVRREGESILLGDDIEVRILDVRRTKVRLGISAPQGLRITTREHLLVREQNLLAAGSMGRAVQCMNSDSVARMVLTATPEDAHSRPTGALP